ncbi:MAG: hypothetical protein U9Q58_01670 [Pseudomonadota bacterium]|nr:hypothetical protein [Pseudomonadota bacterium]
MDTKQRALILETMETMLEFQLKGVRQALGRGDAAHDNVTRVRSRKRKSLVDVCAKILADRKRAVHVDELVEILRDEYGRATDRDSLSSALAKKSKQGILVRRIAPATFEVVE